MNIKERFENTTQKDIVLLYLIGLMISSVIYIFYKDILQVIIPLKLEQQLVPNTIVPLKQNIKKFSDVEYIEYVNKYTREYQVVLKEIKIVQHAIIIKVDGDFKNIIHFLLKVSTNFQIDQFEMNNSDNIISVTLLLSRDFFYKLQSKRKKLANLSNPFVLKEETEKIQSSHIKISAIIGLEVLINNKWYKKDDMINEFKVLKVGKTDLLLRDTIKDIDIIKVISYE